MLSKNYHALLEVQRARLGIIQNSFMPESDLWKKDNDKILSSLVELDAWRKIFGKIPEMFG